MTVDLPEGFSVPVPFTRKSIDDAPDRRGVHIVWEADGPAVYIGKADDTRARMGRHLAGGTTLGRKVAAAVNAGSLEGGGAQAVASWLGERTVSWREHDDPNALKQRLIGELRPQFNSVVGPGVGRTGVWWVNQGRSYEEERDHWLVFAGGATRQLAHHRSLLAMEPGDVTLHYARGLLRAIGEVVVPSADVQRPYGPDATRHIGWLVRTEYFELPEPFALAALPGDRVAAGPFDKHGGVKQGYCYAVEADWAEDLEGQLAGQWPPGSPWSSGQRTWWAVAGEDEHLADPTHASLVDGDAVALSNGAVARAAVLPGGVMQLRPRLGPPPEAPPPSAPPPHPITVEKWRAAVAAAPLEAPLMDRWHQYCGWGRRILDAIDLETDERQFKEEIAAALAEARDALLADGDWMTLLDAAVRPATNNLIDFRVKDRLLKWMLTDVEVAAAALRRLWDAEDDDVAALGAGVALLPVDAVAGAGTRMSVASMLRMAVDAGRCPVIRPRTFRSAFLLVDPETEAPDDEQGWYAAGLAFCDRLVAETSLALNDRLDAQSLVWVLHNRVPPPAWNETEKDAFLAWRAGEAVAPDDHVAELVRKFRSATGYPIEGDEKRHREREELAAALTPEALEDPDIDTLRRLGASAYGSPGSQPGFMRQLQGEASTSALAEWLGRLLHGSEPVEERIEAALNGPHKIPAVKEAMATKALAVTDPDRWFPNYMTGGEVGKDRVLMLVGLEPSQASATLASRMVDVNDRLRATLDPYFPGDPWGIQQFGWWLVQQTETTPPVGVDPVKKLARALTFEPSFVEKVLRLIAHKPQLLFYGPPGTSKTFFALALARHLAGERGTVEIVQFHPSYSYEDFVEGYRPRTVDGQLAYEVVDGPLKRIAAVAEARQDATHVLIVDEFNRAPIAKVLGELYFLLEYRDEHEIRLQYSDAPFTLPPNLVLLATMNTSDRSIALLDAALRRRFHFVGLYPDQEPVAGLLARFLADHGLGDALGWLPAVVDEANRRLDDRHLALGPSHFLRDTLTEADVELVWEHSVLPYIEEQFLDDPSRIQQFSLPALRKAVAPVDELKHTSSDGGTAQNADPPTP